MRVIVTGGAGFVGTLLARRLLAGPVEVGEDELIHVDGAAADLDPPGQQPPGQQGPDEPSTTGDNDPHSAASCHAKN